MKPTFRSMQGKRNSTPWRHVACSTSGELEGHVVKVTQVWQCPECTNQYKASIPVRWVACNKTESHTSRTNKVMKLVEGARLPDRNGAKHET